MPTSAKGQREDEVEPQHLGSILAQNHPVDGGTPQATHLIGGAVTVPATHLIGGTVMVETGHTLHMTEGDHTLLTAGMNHIPLTMAGDHTHLTTADGIVQGPHTATEDAGHLLFRHTTAGTGTDLSPSHPVHLQGPEDGAIRAVYHHREATRAAIPQNPRDQQAILLRKGVKGNPRVADTLARVVIQGKATLIAAVRTPGLCPGSAQLDLRGVSS
ncbi:uncharacterized protein LOC100194272 [Zea mays]|uniref:Serine/arginine-rich splicing factor SR45a n=1 Tax=Zea mays TaxID=4577 RepID=B4FI34_MAIZE|nr:uncharacterized protein LOC100194272 [Zea mays]ACF81777.1 unknown [Zea mays]AQL07804.1 Serine/arginine-rich splicing factor SR45a [Zea mays]|eukprot:NP_001132783.1 uncharacterized protein LOC100194272 [Zea mays]